MDLEKLERKAVKATAKTNKARDKIPKKQRIHRVRSFDEKTGKATYSWEVFTSEKAVKDRIPKKAVRVVRHKVENEIHSKVAEIAEENDAVKAAQKTEQVAESVVRAIKHHRRTKQQKLQRKVKKLEKKEVKANTKYQYEKFKREHPEYDDSFRKRMNQKRRIRKEYAAKFREETAKSVKTLATAVKELIVSKKHTWIIVGVFGLLFIFISASLGSCAMMFAGGGSNTITCSYGSEPEEIDSAENKFTELELGLQNTVRNIQRNHSGYDEYRYNIGPIGHNPFDLINYLSAKNTVFTYRSVETQIQDVFSDMYQLSFRHVRERRTRTETRTGHRTRYRADGSPYTETYTYEVEVVYYVDILESTLAVKTLDEIANANLSGEQQLVYNAYKMTHGGLQQFASPLDLYWYNYLTSFYGYRKNPVNGVDEFHNGIDISVPDGKKVYSGMDSVVAEVGTDSRWGKYICLSDSNGFVIKYAHLSETNVTQGQSIAKGTVIGKTGHSGQSADAHLHIEVSKNGTFFNPAFYFDAESATLYGEGHRDDPGSVVEPPATYSDDAVRALMEEADRYVGYPYVWGGSNPRTSFDCSGYVCYVVTHSGFKSLSRTTAQGIYNQCTPISRSEAKAGDLIFFTRTYNSGSAVTHVGIYCGNGVMVHCGEPIKYASIDTPYWTNHFYSFGRLR